MTKKLLTFAFAFLSAVAFAKVDAFSLPLAFAYTDIAERTLVDYGDESNRNLLVTRDGQRWLIHYNGFCTKPKTGDWVILSVRNELDGVGDALKTGDYHTCDIDQAERIDAILKVESIYSGDTHLIVSDEAANRYQIYFHSSCAAVKGFLRQNIYARIYGTALATGDRFYLPRNQLSCNLNFVESLSETDLSNPNQTQPSVADVAAANKEALNPPSENADNKRPTNASNPRALPGPGKVYVYFRASTDDVGIDHYVVAYSLYRLNTRELEVKDIATFVISTTNSAQIPNLEVGVPWFFYVKAVDKAGNESAEWTTEVTATPRNFSVIGGPRTPVLYLKKSIENSSAFLFRWKRATTVQRQTVILEVDGVRKLTHSEWKNSYIWIDKEPELKGKTLKLTVRTFGLYGQLGEDTTEFRF